MENDLKAVIAAHKYSQNNRPELEKDKKCGCFYCLEVFVPTEISEWLDDTKGTALCPYCGIDSVIGEYSGYPVTEEFLKSMNEYWFSETENKNYINMNSGKL